MTTDFWSFMKQWEEGNGEAQETALEVVPMEIYNTAYIHINFVSILSYVAMIIVYFHNQFRNVQDDEESASDWDDLTPHTSPKHHQSSQHSEPSPQQPHSSATLSTPSQPHLLIARNSHETVSFV